MGTKQFDSATDLITFTRASGGTALRKISYGSELVTNGDFATNVDGWTAQGSATVTHDASGAALVNVTGTGGGIADNQVISTVAGKVYQLSADIKLGTYTNSSFNVVINGAISGYSGITSTYQTFTTIFVASDTDLNLEYKRQTANTGTLFIDNISVKEVTFDQPDGTLQLFNSPANTPRIEYNADGTVKGLLIEEARTNLIPDMHGLENAASRLSKVSTTSPEGSSDAEEYSIASGTGSPYLFSGLPISSGTTYTHSIFVKLPTGTPNVNLRYVKITTQTTFPANEVIFDLQEGVVVGTPDMPDYSITSYGNGWYRISATNTANATASNSFNFILWPLSDSSGTGLLVEDHDVGDKVFEIYGPQTEAGAFPTSYIPTTGSTATRAADDAEIPTSAFGYNQKAGTVLVEFKSKKPLSEQFGAFVLHDGTPNNRIIHYTSSQFHRGFVRTDSGTQADINGGNRGATSELVKFAMAFAENDFAASANGASVDTDTSGTFSSGLSKLGLGYFYPTQTSSNLINGHIKSIKYYPRRLSNAQLQELTT